MRKILWVAIFGMFLMGLPITNAAHAAMLYDDLPYVYSPDSDAAPYDATTTADDVFLNQYSSLRLAKPFDSTDAFVYSPNNSVSQLAGTYGVAASLSSLGSATQYTLAFDYHLYTYDTSSWDVFKVVITQGDYYWGGGAEVGGWSWGGTLLGTLETNDSTPLIYVPVDVAAGGDYYLNVLLITDFVDLSWGRFSDIGVTVTGQPVPEPATMLLLGSGLVGLAGLRRRFRKS